MTPKGIATHMLRAAAIDAIHILYIDGLFWDANMNGVSFFCV